MDASFKKPLLDRASLKLRPGKQDLQDDKTG
jgi:hypothetical protein